jgi:hypothetical protein
MSAVVMIGNDARTMGAVRDVVNERAASLNASEPARRHAVNLALQAVKFGHSAAWAAQEGIRYLRGLQAPVHRGYPNPPEAA